MIYVHVSCVVLLSALFYITFLSFLSCSFMHTINLINQSINQYSSPIVASPSQSPLSSSPSPSPGLLILKLSSPSPSPKERDSSRTRVHVLVSSTSLQTVQQEYDFMIATLVKTAQVQRALWPTVSINVSTKYETKTVYSRPRSRLKQCNGSHQSSY